MTRKLPRKLVLAGGGHAQLAVLRSLIMAPIPGNEITLVNPHRETFYSGMLPGMLAGLFPRDACTIDVAALAARARVRFLEDAVAAVDSGERTIRLVSGANLDFDVLSLDIGARMQDMPDGATNPGIIPVRPLTSALTRIQHAVAEIRAGTRDPELLVIGGGAAGVELAFAFRAALRDVPEANISLLQSASQVLPDVSRAAQQRALDLLEQYGIEVRRGLGRLEPDASGVRTAAGEIFRGQTILWATGAAPFSWLPTSGLVTTADGFLLTGRDLRCRGTDSVFAAGDTAQIDQFPMTPRSGVHAVRQGPVLNQNLRAAMRGRGRLQPYRPQKDFLRLLSTGDGRALAIYRGRTRHGKIWWQLKKQIDTRFLSQHRPPRVDSFTGPDPRMQEEMGDCGGCSAKVAPEILDQAIFKSTGNEPSDPTGREQGRVTITLADRDDAAIFTAAANRRVVVTTDAFPPFADDLALVAEIGAINAASDIYAMGATPRQALVLAGLPAQGTANDLAALQRGAQKAFAELGVEILGGHSVKVETPLIGFTVFGEIGDDPLTKGGAQPGDLLVLSKPLGTGILLAAARGGECPANWWASSIASMRQSNASAAEVFRQTGAHACTDISGFGLLGHALEMLAAGEVRARLDLAKLPALPGARELAAVGWSATGSEALQPYLEEVELEAKGVHAAGGIALLLDPQTSGGLLAAVPPEKAVGLIQADPIEGTDFQIIGEVLPASFQSPRVILDDGARA
ncbi:MAG: selenide, water dikinase SelD [Candidatus Binatia bacterium]|nr:selenide, water dikinase SelD [Candidatus Binatia bacterium]